MVELKLGHMTHPYFAASATKTYCIASFRSFQDNDKSTKHITIWAPSTYNKKNILQILDPARLHSIRFLSCLMYRVTIGQTEYWKQLRNHNLILHKEDTK